MSVAKSTRLRAVLDTNVYFSAFRQSQGVPFDIWQQALSRQFTLLVSPAILREIAAVLRLDLGLQESEIVTQLKLISRVAEIVVPKTSLQVVKADPDDDKFLECAVEGHADLIVSGDRHLTNLKSFRGIGIVRPIDFQRSLGRGFEN
jgi:putative PIN family toxin of toxin-antitoxin system